MAVDSTAPSHHSRLCAGPKKPPTTSALLRRCQGHRQEIVEAHMSLPHGYARNIKQSTGDAKKQDAEPPARADKMLSRQMGPDLQTSWKSRNRTACNRPS